MSLRLTALAVTAGVALTLAPMAPAHAQDVGTATGLTFTVTPYLWIAGISGSMRTPRDQIVPSQDIDVRFGDTLSNLSGLAFMGAAEVRYGRFGLLGDFMTLHVENDVSTRGPLHSGGTARVTTTMGSVLAMARVMEGAEGDLDLGAGIRPWSVSTRLSLNPGLLPGTTLRPSLSWTDPVLALRYSCRFDDRWGATAYGDIGGFGTGSELTWQVLGTVDYRWGEATTMRVGYRHLQLENSKAGTDIAIGLSGPIIGVTIRF